MIQAEPVTGGYGRLVRIDHGGDVQTYYAHLSHISVREGQEVRRVTGEPGGHAHGLGVGREVDQRTALELEDRLARVAVMPVLVERVGHGLPGERVLELDRDYRDAVET